MTNEKYPVGIDCGWLGEDSLRNIGIFITAGVAPIPIHALAISGIAVEDVEALVLDLPKIGEAELLINVPSPDSFIGLAERGLFVYDWQDVHCAHQDATGAYVAVAIPSKPIKSNELSGILAVIATTTVFEKETFLNSKQINVNNWFECLSDL